MALQHLPGTWDVASTKGGGSQSRHPPALPRAPHTNFPYTSSHATAAATRASRSTGSADLLL